MNIERKDLERLEKIKNEIDSLKELLELTKNEFPGLTEDISSMLDSLRAQYGVPARTLFQTVPRIDF